MWKYRQSYVKLCKKQGLELWPFLATDSSITITVQLTGCSMSSSLSIPLARAECDDSLPFSGTSSIPLCYVLFPATLLHQLFFHSSLLRTFSCHPSPPTILPSSLTSSCHLFLGLPLNLVVPKFIYNTQGSFEKFVTVYLYLAWGVSPS